MYKTFANFDFTLDKYERLCQAVAASKYTPVTLSGYLSPGQDRSGSYLVMRHDIDRSPTRALGTAALEYKYRIPASYYFRDRRATFVPEIMDRVAALGHEIGYHYETVDKCNGDMDRAMTLFGIELGDFRTRYDVKTVCAHGNPLTRYDNKDIWKRARLSDFALLGEAFLSLDYSRFAYFSDSGRTWLNNRSQKMPGKDSVATAFDDVTPQSTDDVISIVTEGSLPNICVLAHSERWTGDVAGFTRRYLLDLAFSCAKVGIYACRRTITR